jgi:hypothetical protein
MTEAIFGLVGVIVGAVSQGGWVWTMERRREEWAARKAGRLLARSLTRVRFILKAGSEDPDLVSWGVLEIEIESALERWPEHADALAGTLTDSNQWHEIVQAVEALERIHNRAKYGGGEVTPKDAEAFGDIAELTWGAAFTCSLIGVAGIRRHPVSKLRLRLRRWLRGFDAEEEARKLRDYAYVADGMTPRDEDR